MKNLKFLLGFALLGLLVFTSCEKEAVNENLTPEAILEMFSDDIKAYIERHDEIKVEYSTLEKLNDVLLENGIQPYTLEDLDATQEEYDLAQIKIQNLENDNSIESRCDKFLAVYFGDCSDNGILSAGDLAPFHQALLYDNFSTCTEYEFQQFGYITAVWNYGNIYPTIHDKIIASRIILGLEDCK